MRYLVTWEVTKLYEVEVDSDNEHDVLDKALEIEFEDWAEVTTEDGYSITELSIEEEE